MPSYINSDFLSKLSVNELLSKLHEAIKEFAETIDSLIEHNKSVNYKEINELRNMIKKRIEKGENIDDNTKILKILELFSANKSVMELVREDVDEWLEFIDAIEEGIKNSRLNLKGQDEMDFKKIQMMNAELRTLIRASK
ncbi:MAG: hypothetical protein M1331_02985 [Candidatus Marsarchaeota archaeon]|nr:hypothetical protein [Candidatus Marsarchaeota archaeon]MCL5106331.1 hypothetical protein [Candidatus Marsarchaeota archaeon]